MTNKEKLLQIIGKLERLEEEKFKSINGNGKFSYANISSKLNNSGINLKENIEKFYGKYK